MKSIPPILVDHILPFNWDVRKVWQLSADVIDEQVEPFLYLMDLPLWSDVPYSGMLFNISPSEVLNNPKRSPHQMNRVLSADTLYPLDFLTMNSKLWILDGVHRLAKLVMQGDDNLSIRVHDENINLLIESI